MSVLRINIRFPAMCSLLLLLQMPRHAIRPCPLSASPWGGREEMSDVSALSASCLVEVCKGSGVEYACLSQRVIEQAASEQ